MARIRSDVKQLGDLLESCECPVYALDNQRRVVYCNDACLRWLDVTRADLLGRRCNYHTDSVSPTDVTQLLGPPPEIFLGDVGEQQVVLHDSNGGVSRRVVRFMPLGKDTSGVDIVAVALPAFEDVAETPIPGDETAALLHQQLQQLVAKNRGRYRLEPWAGEGIAMRRVREQVRIAIESRSAAAILGPVGAGRESLARAIYGAQNDEGAPPLLPLSCATLDAPLFQATLVAFLQRFSSGALPQQPTVLLLDADQLTTATQLELLGFTRLPTIAMRILSTAEQSLRQLASAGRFDAELAERLSSLEIELPALANRREDIPLLSQRIIERLNMRGEKQLGGCSPEVLDLLGAMPWQRNLEELVEVLELAWETAEGPLVQPADLPERVRLVTTAAEYPAPVDDSIELDSFLREIERELITRALKRAQGNKAQAARSLGIQRTRLLRRISLLGVEEMFEG